MVGKSTKNTRNVIYEVDGLIFPSRFVFSTIESIDRNLGFLYTPGTEDNDFEPTFDFPVRENDKEFAAILKRVEERIKRITGIDDTKNIAVLFCKNLKRLIIVFLKGCICAVNIEINLKRE